MIILKIRLIFSNKNLESGKFRAEYAFYCKRHSTLISPYDILVKNLQDLVGPPEPQ